MSGLFVSNLFQLFKDISLLSLGKTSKNLFFINESSKPKNSKFKFSNILEIFCNVKRCSCTWKSKSLADDVE